MTRTISTSGVDEKLITLYVDTATKEKLDAMKIENSDRIQIPVEGLAVTLTGDNTVGFGSSATGAATDVLFGLIKSYNGANTVGVQYKGFATDVPAHAAIAKGVNVLVATNAGKINTVASGGSASRATAIKAATASDLFVDILIG